jgi:hypothetical protein
LYIHPFVLFTHSLLVVAEEEEGVGWWMEMMKNLQNYAKNVQLVKRNIVLCVACFFYLLD